LLQKLKTFGTQLITAARGFFGASSQRGNSGIDGYQLFQRAESCQLGDKFLVIHGIHRILVLELRNEKLEEFGFANLCRCA
jgi:hypothetical protein